MQGNQATQYPDSMAQIENLYRKRDADNRKVKVLAVLAFILITITAVLLRWGLFKVKEIAVVGLNTISYQELMKTVRRAGLEIGSNMPSIDCDAVKNAINDDYRFVLQDILLDYRKQTVLLDVKERKALAVIEVRGTQYTVSDDGYVMGVYDGSSMKVPKATGLEVQSAQVGTKILNTNTALEGLRALLYELEMQKVLPRVTEINLTDMNSIMLYTQEKRTVIIGDAAQIMKKIVAMRTAENLIYRINAMGGETINVSNPEAVVVQLPQG